MSGALWAKCDQRLAITALCPSGRGARAMDVGEILDHCRVVRPNRTVIRLLPPGRDEANKSLCCGFHTDQARLGPSLAQRPGIS